MEVTQWVIRIWEHPSAAKGTLPLRDLQKSNPQQSDIPQCLNFWHFTGGEKNAERYRIGFELGKPPT